MRVFIWNRIKLIWFILLWIRTIIMANRTVKDAKTIHGTNPQYLVEKIIRARIYESRYWKEYCFAVNGNVWRQI